MWIFCILSSWYLLYWHQQCTMTLLIEAALKSMYVYTCHNAFHLDKNILVMEINTPGTVNFGGRGLYKSWYPYIAIIRYSLTTNGGIKVCLPFASYITEWKWIWTVLLEIMHSYVSLDSFPEFHCSPSPPGLLWQRCRWVSLSLLLLWRPWPTLGKLHFIWVWV